MEKVYNITAKLKIIMATLFLITFFSLFDVVQAAVNYKTGIENFPKTYQGYLMELQKKHPKWTFVAMYTGLDYTNTIHKESYIGRSKSISLIYKAWDKAWHYFENGNTVQIESGWVTASSQGVEYTIDPRNYLNEQTIFQFLDLKYSEGKQTLAGVEQILYGTEMSQVYYDENGSAKYKIKDIEYWSYVNDDACYEVLIPTLNFRSSAAISNNLICAITEGMRLTVLEKDVTKDSYGTWCKVRLEDGREGYVISVNSSGKVYISQTQSLQYIKYLYDKDGDGTKESPMTYAEAFMLAAQKSNISPYTLALRTKSETACKITSDVQLFGKSSVYPATYNYYSVGAYGSNPALNGLKYADSKGWHDPVTAICEGAIWWGKSYIMAGQNTGYLQKFNVNADASNAVYNHQYMTNITCAYKEALGLYSTYNKLGLIEDTFVFVIPVFDNMPEIPVDIYTMYNGAFEKEQEMVKVKQDTSIYSIIPTGKTGTSVIEITKIPAGTEIQKMYAGVSSSYDKVAYSVNGNNVYGYIYYNTYEIATTADNTKLKVVAEPSINLRKSPTTSSGVIRTLATGEIITRIEKNSSVDTTGIWDKVVLSDGTVGYVCRKTTGGDNYLTEYDYVKVTDIALLSEKYEVSAGEKINIGASVTPSNAEFARLKYTSSDTNIATVDSDGNVTGIYPGIVTIEVVNEDQNITKKCEVQVNSKIQLDKELYIISIEQSITPRVKVNGKTDSEYGIAIYAEELAETDNEDINIYTEDNSISKHVIQINGKEIKGLNEGEATIKIYTENLVEYAAVKVTKEVLNIQFAEPLEVVVDKEVKLLTRVEPGYTSSKLNEKIRTNAQVKYVASSGDELNAERNVGTGTKLQFTYNEQNDEYTVVIKGDINGDGKISASDYVVCKNYIMGIKELAGVYKDAADVNKDGKVSASDYVKCKNYIMGTANIEF